MIMECPCCGRRLLSHTSAYCNWCGAPVADREYQRQAEAERERYFAHQADRDALELARVEAIDIGSTGIAPRRSWNPPATGTVPKNGNCARLGAAVRRDGEPPPTDAEADGVAPRFRHLEL